MPSWAKGFVSMAKTQKGRTHRDHIRQKRRRGQCRFRWLRRRAALKRRVCVAATRGICGEDLADAWVGHGPRRSGFAEASACEHVPAAGGFGITPLTLSQSASKASPWTATFRHIKCLLLAPLQTIRYVEQIRSLLHCPFRCLRRRISRHREQGLLHSPPRSRHFNHPRGRL